MMLEIQNLHVFYGKAESLHGVSLDVEAGKIIAIIGPVGAGKSTLFDAIFGLNTWTGNIKFEGTDLSTRTSAKIVKMGISYAPERGNLFTPDECQRQFADRGLYRTSKGRQKFGSGVRTVSDPQGTGITGSQHAKRR